MTIGVGPEYIVVYLPAADPTTLHITWNPIAFYSPNNEGKTTEAEWPAYVDEFTELNARNPIWQKLGNPAMQTITPLDEDEVYIPSPGCVQADIAIAVPALNVSREWIPSDFGNYGTLRGTKGGAYGKLQFIQSQAQTFNFNAGDIDGVIIKLPKGSTGLCTLTHWLGIPPVGWAINGGAIQQSNSPYPFFGILPW